MKGAAKHNVKSVLKHHRFMASMCLRPAVSRQVSLAVIVSTLLVGGRMATAATFDEQRAAISAAVETQTEETIIAFLKAGIEENRPAQAATLAGVWLRQNLPKDAILLYHAGRASELNGDWKEAAAFYQQFLKKADPKSAEAGDAITAVYTLLANQLGDAAGAYAFGRNEAERLDANPRFRQWDRWFINVAINARDGEAVATRLLGVLKAGVPNDQLVALYDGDFRWLLNAVDGYIEQPQAVPFSQELYDATKELCEAMTFDEELKLRLDWAVSVKAYNLAQIGGEGSPKSIRKRGAGSKKGAPATVAPGSPVEKIAPPVAEATALLAKYPQYAKWVQDGWAGGGNGQHYRSDPKKYWVHEVDAKMAPVVAALPKLTALQRDELLQSWGKGYYGGSPEVLEVKAAHDYLLARSELINSRAGPFFSEKAWNQLSVPEIAKLGPQLEQNSDPRASLVRASAAGGADKNFDKMMAALLGPEAWRLGPVELGGAYVDQLWNYCGRPGNVVKRDAEIARSKAFAATFAAADAKKEDPAAQRIALFEKLWADYQSPQPKTPALRSRLAASLQITPELVPKLLADPSPEAQGLVRDAIAKGMEGPKGPLSRDPRARELACYRYDPWILRVAALNHDFDWLKQHGKDLYAPHPLEPVLRSAVANLLKQNKVEAWLTMAWINAQFPENNAESVKLMEALFKSPAWQTLPNEVRFGARAWFKQAAMTPAQFACLQASDASLICKDLLALPKSADVATTVAALGKALEGLKKSPVRIEIQGLDQLAAVSDEVFADPKVLALIVQLTDSIRSFEVPQNFGNRLLAAVAKTRDPATLLRTAAYLWRHTELYHRTLPTIMDLADSLVDGQVSAASALAQCGLQTFARYRAGHHYFVNETDIPRLKAIRGKAAMKLGLIVIPVAQNDPAYPIYQSQAEWMGGNEDSAWKALDAHWEAFVPLHRELSVPYLMWALQRTIYSRNEERQEVLVKSLLGWSSGAGSSFTPTEKANVELAYGDIALQRGQIRQAHEIYIRTQQNPAYKELPVRHEAALRRIRAERIAKDFEGALKTIAELEMEREPEIWTPTRFARAEVNFDMEEYDNAKDDIESILTRDPNHADARILLGKVQLKRQKLMEATEVELGSVTGQKSLVPGEKLKVTLSDPTLAVSGAGTEIEVVVWANSGDKESFFLRQFGDQKTKFRGEVATALGAPKPGDGVLQVIGNDEVFYGYSERFRAKMNNLAEKRGGPITVASDAILMASARKLLTEAEQRIADMETLMEDIKVKGHGDIEGAARAEMAARSLDAESRAQSQGISESRFKRHMLNVAKPGNSVHVRVIDADRSRSAGIDELTVSASSSSGDSVSRITLKETGTHSGWFEGSIPTTGAQAMAFAENSEPGRNPNMVISPLTTYPAWRPVATKNSIPRFTVDLNDNVDLGELKIKAAEAGAKLGKFIVQTAMDPLDWTSVASYPDSKLMIENPWRPSIAVVNEVKQGWALRTDRNFYSLMSHLETGWLEDPQMATAKNVAGPSEAMPRSILTDVKWQRQTKYPNPAVVARFRAWFYESEQVQRHFKLTLGKLPPAGKEKNPEQQAEFLLVVDGKVLGDKDGHKLEGELSLKPGIHRIEIWASGWLSNIGFGREVKLQANLDDPEQLVDCPDAFFNPEKFPAEALDHRNGPATIAAADNGTGFSVKFAKDSRARLLRLVFIEQQGQVPALNSLALTNSTGKRILPVAEDFAVLNKNETLEILSGDKISVRYVDDRFVTKAKEKQERFLDVSFTDARAEFADIEPRFSAGHGKNMPYHEKLLRFQYDKPLTFTVQDGDMDVSAQPDKVKVTLATKAGKREFDAVETEESSGLFKLVVIPVAGSASGNQIQVAAGGTITARYLDQENKHPGVPVERVASIAHAAFTLPQLALSHASVTPLESNTTSALVHGFERMDYQNPGQKKVSGDRVQRQWQISSKLLPVTQAPEGGFAAVLGQIVCLELIAPQLALGVSSKVTVYAQTEAGRRQAAADGGAAAPSTPFDITVPGTIALTGATSESGEKEDNRWRSVPLLPIYQAGAVWSHRDQSHFDRFRMCVPLVVGTLPNEGVLSEDEVAERAKQAKASLGTGEIAAAEISGLVVQPGDRIHFGFLYTDAAGAKQWLSASSKVLTHPVFDIMTEDFRAPMTSAYVGETLNLRVVDLGADVSDAMDEVSVLMQAKSGAKYAVKLQESGPHTGIFKGGYMLTYAETGSTKENESATYDVKQLGFPVAYGDSLAARYTDANGVKTRTSMVTISKGADGKIEPFSKKYDDPEIAMRTQFSLAEAYLEIAKRHRKLNEPDAAAIEYGNAKQLLSKAMDQFTDPETRAHAEYLLGNLTMEEADETKDAELKETRYRAALSRFLNVTGTYPTTQHASKAQYKIATVYEALKEPEIASQEYVKLAYKYPDSEFLAVSMARLGSHFLKKAAAYEAQAKPLLAKAAEDKDARFEGEALQKMAVGEYLKTANIFGRLQARFPGNELAGDAGLRAGQAYMRAGKTKEAIESFQKVIAEQGYDGPKIRSQAMYWVGMCYLDIRQAMAAYSAFKRLTYDFPESQWAAFARGQLSQENLLNLEDKLELNRLEGGR